MGQPFLIVDLKSCLYLSLFLKKEKFLFGMISKVICIFVLTLRKFKLWHYSDYSVNRKKRT